MIYRSLLDTINRSPLTTTTDTPVEQVIILMSQNRSSSILIIEKHIKDQTERLEGNMKTYLLVRQLHDQL